MAQQRGKRERDMGSLRTGTGREGRADGSSMGDKRVCPVMAPMSAVPYFLSAKALSDRTNSLTIGQLRLSLPFTVCLVPRFLFLFRGRRFGRGGRTSRRIPPIADLSFHRCTSSSFAKVASVFRLPRLGKGRKRISFPELRLFAIDPSRPKFSCPRNWAVCQDGGACPVRLRRWQPVRVQDASPQHFALRLTGAERRYSALQRYFGLSEILHSDSLSHHFGRRHRRARRQPAYL